MDYGLWHDSKRRLALPGQQVDYRRAALYVAGGLVGCLVSGLFWASFLGVAW